ncbi:hypothetical protein L1267_18980 [Pseudoalteromonas sp. OFAV1]|uniref:hypothetical protein n=1 Tax=Pseudoalteromonas sp. OFAV1 TaxID=2908892 RepID=UPI001F28EFD4|nr:hypothetical protein [Pseudoalteromonas sp. OFAV1]MCF2902458.1 hypothetical protein [Pseudoalteromonas sp. OFAV1]
MFTNVMGFYIPCLLALIAFVFILRDQKKVSAIYPVSFLVSLCFAGGVMFGLELGWVVRDDNQTSLHLVATFPLIVFSYKLLRMVVNKKHYDYFNIQWVYLGTFSTMAISDVLMAYFHIENAFYSAIGGAGIYDALFVLPLSLVFVSILINKQVKGLSH